MDNQLVCLGELIRRCYKGLTYSKRETSCG